MRKSKLLFFLLIFLAFKSNAQGLEFFRQDMVYEIKNDYFYVDGNYFLCNVSKNKINSNLFYPYPIDSLYGKVDSVMIINLDSNKEVKYYRDKDQGMYFEAKVNPLSVATYKIKYRQKLKGDKAEYILVTAQLWKKPLEIAKFKLIVPENLKINSISYKTDSVYMRQNKRIYVWKIKDFEPKENLVIRFIKE